MTYGLELRDASGRVVLSTAEIGGVFIERLTLTAGASSSKTYNADTRYSGRTLRIIQSDAGSHEWAVGTSGGYPQLTWTAKPHGGNADDTIVLVFAV